MCPISSLTAQSNLPEGVHILEHQYANKTQAMEMQFVDMVTKTEYQSPTSLSAFAAVIFAVSIFTLDICLRLGDTSIAIPFFLYGSNLWKRLLKSLYVLRIDEFTYQHRHRHRGLPTAWNLGPLRLRVVVRVVQGTTFHVSDTCCLQYPCCHCIRTHHVILVSAMRRNVRRKPCNGCTIGW